MFALATRSSRTEATTAPAAFISAFALGALPVLVWSLCSAWNRRQSKAGPPIEWTAANITSGVATILIVTATVVAFMFEQVSILLALLMMRLGVLLMAPLFDLVGGRSISAPTLVAGFVCVIGIGVAGAAGTFSPLSGPVGLVLIVYLMGYAVRLGLMTRHTKSEDRAVRGNWFIAETSMVAAALVLIGASAGFTGHSFIELSRPGLFAAVVSGAAYAYALINGTLIYLDWRNNAHSVTINRSTSLLSGVAASLAGWALLDMDIPATREWMLAAFMGVALLILASAEQGGLMFDRRRKN